MIRASDRKNNSVPAASYEESHDSALGIAFERKDGTRRFVPYALLSAIDFNCDDELSLSFGFNSIVIHGRNLEPLWNAACHGKVERVWESEEAPPDGRPWVRELLFPELHKDVERDELLFTRPS